jgi:hypothetical protein
MNLENKFNLQKINLIQNSKILVKLLTINIFILNLKLFFFLKFNSSY